jgi:hypothetical protein
MDPFEEPGQRRVVSIPSLTAWLSVCILAAAWGRSLDESWQQIWSEVGAYGLAASVGLGFVEKARFAQKKHSREKALAARADFGLARLSEQGATLDSIQAAVRRLQAGAKTSRHESTGGAAGKHDRRIPTLAGLPLEITPIVDHDDTSCELDQAIDGSLRDVTSRSIAFRHARPFVAPHVVLSFALEDGQRLSFVVEVLTTEVADEGFVTRGAVLEVGVPSRHSQAALAGEPADACAV